MKLNRKALCVLSLLVAVAAVVVLVLTLENRRHAKKIHRSIIPGVPTPRQLGPGGENQRDYIHPHMKLPNIRPNLGPGGENRKHRND